MSNEYLSEYLQYLPAAYSADLPTAQFLGRFLIAFQGILTGIPPGEPGPPAPAIEQVLDRVHTYFLPDPDQQSADRAPDEFLPWLASWVAASLRDDWPPEVKRRFIQQAPSLYARRGTSECIRTMLSFHFGDIENIQLVDDNRHPYFFSVEISNHEVANFPARERIARSIIDREKPAHTYYALIFTKTGMCVGDNRTGVIVGEDTVL